MKVGDLLNIDGYGVGTVVEIWLDEDDDCEHASIWLVAEQRYLFITDWDRINKS